MFFLNAIGQMDTENEKSYPNYTARLLVDNIFSDRDTSSLKLKAFSHFTLACNYYKIDFSMTKAFAELAEFLQGPLTLQAEEVVNLNTEDKPLWAVKLNLGEHGEAFRNKLSELFDEDMCHENNGVCYLWNPVDGAPSKCPHITMGFKPEDFETATRLVTNKYVFTFAQMDYKRVGPHDPHIAQKLNAQETLECSGLSCR